MDHDGITDPLKAALAHWRDERFAELIVVAVGLAAKTHPDELRKALASVFDLSQWENEARRLGVTYQVLLQKQSELAAEQECQSNDLERAAAAIDGLRGDFAKLTAMQKKVLQPSANGVK